MKQDQNPEILSRLKEAVDTGDIGLWDLRLGLDIVYYSPGWKYRLGLPDPELPDSIHFWRCRVHPDDLQDMLSSMRAHLRRSTSSYDCIFRLRSNGSGYRLIHSRGRVVEQGQQQRATRLVGTMIDLTPRPCTPRPGIPHCLRSVEMSTAWVGVPFHSAVNALAKGEAATAYVSRPFWEIHDLLLATLAELKSVRI